MEQHKFWSLLARKLAGEASLRDLYELNKVVYEQPELQFWLKLVTDLWRNREAIEKEPAEKKRFCSFYKRLIKENTCGIKQRSVERVVFSVKQLMAWMF